MKYRCFDIKNVQGTLMLRLTIKSILERLRHCVLIVMWLHRMCQWCNKLCSEASLSPPFLVLLGNTECVKTWYWDIREQCLFGQAEIQIQTPKTAIPHTDLIWTMQGLSWICIRVRISFYRIWEIGCLKEWDRNRERMQGTVVKGTFGVYSRMLVF